VRGAASGLRERGKGLGDRGGDGGRGAYSMVVGLMVTPGLRDRFSMRLRQAAVAGAAPDDRRCGGA